MYKQIYDEIRNELSDISNEKSDEKFVSKLILLNGTYMLEECFELIELGKSTYALPILRQLYEYLIIMMGIEEKITTIPLFVRNKQNKYVGKLAKSIILKEKEKKENDDKVKFFDEIMRALYSMLSEHSHANMDRLIFFTIEKLEGKMKNILIEDIKIIFEILHKLYVTSSNLMIKTKFEVDKIDMKSYTKRILEQKGEKISSETLKRLMNIESIHNKLSKRLNDIIEISNEKEE